MKYRGLFLLWLALLCFLNAQEIIPVREIKPGMTGHGVSVFRGSRIERFNVEVIDVLTGFMPGEDVILVRCSAAYGGFDIARSGVIAGMSGSPVYIDGKLAGAVAYGWAYARQPIAGVTSIESMLKMANRPLVSSAARASQNTNSPPPLKTCEAFGLTPLMAPLMVSGATPRGIAEIKKTFDGLSPVHASSNGGQIQNTPDTLSPGSPVGAQLMSGDMDITAIGTVTWVKGEEFLAFGHPFLNAGEFRIPITSAHIATVMESNAFSFKLGFPVKKLGTLYQDRYPGIYGRLGNVCDMIPMRVKIKNRLNQEERNYKVEMISHSFFTLRLCAIAIYNFLDAQEATWGENTAWYRSKIYLSGVQEPLEWSEMFTHTTLIMGNFLDPLIRLYKNPFQRPNLQKIEVEIEISPKLQYAEITSIRLPYTEVEPGETLPLTVVLSPQYEPPKEFTFPITIPENIPDGAYFITAVNPAKLSILRSEPENDREYLESLKSANRYKNNALVIGFALPSLTVKCQGQELKDLPHSVIGNLLPTNRNRDIQLIPDVYIASLETPYVLSGLMHQSIQVKSKRVE